MTTAHKTDRVQPLNLGAGPSLNPDKQEGIAPAAELAEAQARERSLALEVGTLRARVEELSRPRVPVPKEHETAVLSMCLARIAMRAGCKVLAYRLKPTERVASVEGPWIVTVHLPEDLGQVVFSFTDEQADLLRGIPNSGAYPVALSEVANETYEGIVRAMLGLVPEALKVADESPWRGHDSSPASHERLMRSL